MSVYDYLGVVAIIIAVITLWHVLSTLYEIGDI